MNLTRLAKQLDRLERLNDQPEHKEPTRPTGQYVLRFYDRRRQLISEHTAADCHFLARYYEQHLRGTPYEYMIRLKHTAFYKHNEYGQLRKYDACSYVDIICDHRFVCRHFYRGGQLSPLVSYEANINNDAYARLVQLNTTPTINWSALFNDAAWGLVSKNISQREFVNKYSLSSGTKPK